MILQKSHSAREHQIVPPRLCAELASLARGFVVQQGRLRRVHRCQTHSRKSQIDENAISKIKMKIFGVFTRSTLVP